MALLFCLFSPALTTGRTNSLEPSDQSDVRAAVQRVFDQLKAGQYESLYDSLPSSSRTRLTRDRFVAALQRSRNLYQLDRIEIGAPRISGDLALVDTTMYAHISPPFDAEGKLVVQQYLVREEGSWRVATGDRATIDRFLKSNPAFARRFPIKPPRVYIKQNGQWTEFDPRSLRQPK
jgi:hypothetical protein